MRVHTIYKGITHYFKQRLIKKATFDVSKLPQDMSQFTIGAIQNELKSVGNVNEVVITSGPSQRLQLQLIRSKLVNDVKPSCSCVSSSPIDVSQSFRNESVRMKISQVTI